MMGGFGYVCVYVSLCLSFQSSRKSNCKTFNHKTIIIIAKGDMKWNKKAFWKLTYSKSDTFCEIVVI